MWKFRPFRVIHFSVVISLFLLFLFCLFNTYINKPADARRERDIIADVEISRKGFRSGESKFVKAGRIRDEQDLLFNIRRSESRGISNGNVVFSGSRIVHLDLKGAPPKVSYLVKIFPILSHLGANGILIEYEDMFPYSTIKHIAARNSYSINDVNAILKAAKENNLEVIPLIQTFGHAESVLKLREYKHLREVPAYPQAYCPSKNESLRVIESILDDVLMAHPDAKYFHIGCDEVYHLARCDQCKHALQTNNWTKNDIFKNHVKTIAEYIKTSYPNIEILMWDDEFRSWSLAELKDSGLGDLVLPVVWNYGRDLTEVFSPTLWTTYSAVFKKIWIASAFKGAAGSDATALDLDVYTTNHQSWMNIVEQNSKYVEFSGIILTGWQRYDHFSVLCELFPVAFPSLAVNLAYLSGTQNSIEKVKMQMKEELKCDSSLGFIPENGFTNHCDFPGSGVYEAVTLLSSVTEDIWKKKSTSAFRGWFSKYNRDKHFSSPSLVEMAVEGLNEINNELTSLELKLTETMDGIYDKYTVEEWLQTHLKPHQDEIKSLLRSQMDLLQRDEWPRRPLPDYKIK